MKIILRSNLSFVLAILVLLSTMSFTVEKPFCGNILVGNAVFTPVNKCKSETGSCGVEGTMSHMIKGKDSCCLDNTESLQGQDELRLHLISFDIVPKAFVVPMSFVLTDLLLGISFDFIPYPPYQPPQLVYDVHSLCQVFSI